MESDVLVAEGNAAAHAGKAITDVIFDFGNVLVFWDPGNAMVGRYSRDSIEWFLDDANSGLYSASDLMDGGTSCAEAEAWVLANRGERAAEMIRYYDANFVDSLGGAVPGARKLIEDLKAAGVGVWGLSNWASELFPIAWSGWCPAWSGCASHTPISMSTPCRSSALPRMGRCSWTTRR